LLWSSVVVVLALVLVLAFVIVGTIAVGILADDGEVRVEVGLYLTAVLEADLDAVGGAVVAGFGLGDGAAAGLLEGSVDRPIAGRAGQWLLVIAARRRRLQRPRGPPANDPSGLGLHRCALSSPAPVRHAPVGWRASRASTLPVDT
jgi:hypothetical protein